MDLNYWFMMNNKLLICVISMAKMALADIPEPVSLQELDPRRTAWSEEVASEVNPYFKRQYLDAPDDLLECLDESVVYRPNHGLGHGMRQGYLAVDIAVFMDNARRLYSDTDVNDLQTWIRKKAKDDKLFLQKLEFANSFQRSGRESDIAKGTNPTRYAEFLAADRENFQKAAQRRIGTLFNNQAEIEIYKHAITDVFEPNSEPSDLTMLSKIFYSAHLFDLRRLPDFDKAKIQENIARQLFATTTPTALQKNFIDKVWQRTGDYLDATGDRDMEDAQKRLYNTKVFCELAHNPKAMVRALQHARIKSEKKLLQQSIAHAGVIREIKQRAGVPYSSTPFALSEEEQQRVDEFRNTLKGAQYTASEAYLKIENGEMYIETPPDLPKGLARKNVDYNLRTFLGAIKRKIIHDDRSVTYGPRIPNPDQHYVDTLVDAIMAERANRDKIVLYQTTEPEMGVFIDVFSQIRNQLLMSGGRDMSALRVLDEGFLKLDEENKKANVRKFMAAFKGVSDDKREYADLMLSTNFSIVGSDQQVNADTYNMFFEVKDRKVVTTELDYEAYLQHVQTKTGIPLRYEDFKAIVNRTVLTDEFGKPYRNGRLIQIFVDPEVLVDIGYLSVLMGAPVLKDGVNADLDEAIKKLRTSPLTFHEYVKGMTGANISTKPHLKRLSQLELHDLQVRLFMRPEVMFNPQLIKIISYWRFPEGDHMRNYYRDIAKLINDSLVVWYQKGAPMMSGAFAPDTVKLTKLIDMVYQGSTKEKMPRSSLTLPEQFVALVTDDKNEDAANFLATYFEQLKDQQFTTLPTRSRPETKTLSLKSYLNSECSSNLPVIKVAFDNGIFAGGDETFKIYRALRHFKQEFLKTLDEIKDPEATSTLFNKYISSIANEAWPINLYKSINGKNNDEEYAKNLSAIGKVLVKNPHMANSMILAINTYNFKDDNERSKILDEIVSIFTKQSQFFKLPINYNYFDTEEAMTKFIGWLKYSRKNADDKFWIFTTARLLERGLQGDPSSWSNVVSFLSSVPQSTLTHVAKNLDVRHVFPSDEINTMTVWARALGKSDPVSTGEEACPNKAYFRAILTESAVRNALSTQSHADFVDADKKWRVSNAQVRGVDTELENLLKNLNPYNLAYDTSDSPKRCIAKFSQRGVEKIRIDLDLVVPDDK